LPTGKPSLLLTSRGRPLVAQFPDYDDDAHVITKVVRRKFAFAREVGEYDELIEGAGQEPLNSVYYKDWDDRMRTRSLPHPLSPRRKPRATCAALPTSRASHGHESSTLGGSHVDLARAQSTGRTAMANATVGPTSEARGSRLR
jgi:hypothetical protein